MPNKAPRMMVHLLRLGRVMVVVVLSWDMSWGRMMMRVGMVWLRLVVLLLVLLCNLGSIVFGFLVCARWWWPCGVFWCVLMV